MISYFPYRYASDIPDDIINSQKIDLTIKVDHEKTDEDLMLMVSDISSITEIPENINIKGLMVLYFDSAKFYDVVASRRDIFDDIETLIIFFNPIIKDIEDKKLYEYCIPQLRHLHILKFSNLRFTSELLIELIPAGVNFLDEVSTNGEDTIDVILDTMSFSLTMKSLEQMESFSIMNSLIPKSYDTNSKFSLTGCTNLRYLNSIYENFMSYDISYHEKLENLVLYTSPNNPKAKMIISEDELENINRKLYKLRNLEKLSIFTNDPEGFLKSFEGDKLTNLSISLHSRDEDRIVDYSDERLRDNMSRLRSLKVNYNCFSDQLNDFLNHPHLSLRELELYLYIDKPTIPKMDLNGTIEKLTIKMRNHYIVRRYMLDLKNLKNLSDLIIYMNTFGKDPIKFDIDMDTNLSKFSMINLYNKDLLSKTLKLNPNIETLVLDNSDPEICWDGDEKYIKSIKSKIHLPNLVSLTIHDDISTEYIWKLLDMPSLKELTVIHPSEYFERYKDEFDGSIRLSQMYIDRVNVRKMTDIIQDEKDEVLRRCLENIVYYSDEMTKLSKKNLALIEDNYDEGYMYVQLIPDTT